MLPGNTVVQTLSILQSSTMFSICLTNSMGMLCFSERFFTISSVAPKFVSQVCAHSCCSRARATLTPFSPESAISLELEDRYIPYSFGPFLKLAAGGPPGMESVKISVSSLSSKLLIRSNSSFNNDVSNFFFVLAVPINLSASWLAVSQSYYNP